MASRRGAAAIWVLLALLIVGSSPVRAHAGCAFGPDSPEAVEFADVIFTGEIISESQKQAVFAVDRVYKGKAHAEQAVLGGPTDTGGYALPASGPGRFLILARLAQRGEEPGVLVSGPCSGSRLGEAPARLGAGYPPVPGSSVVAGDQPNTRATAWWGLGALLAGALAVLGLAYRRFLRASAR